jgi:integration host factor subunit beta
MTKSDLIAELARRFPQLVAKDADMSVKMILDAMAEALARGDRIEIRGFGSFALNYRPPRVGRNPKSGDKVEVPKNGCRISRQARNCGSASTVRWSRSDARLSVAYWRAVTRVAARFSVRRVIVRALLWASRIVLFLFLFAFAVKNTEPVGVRFLLNTVWHAPLVIVLLAFFVAGAALAVLSLIGRVFGLRREVARLKRQRARQSAGEAGSQV